MGFLIQVYEIYYIHIWYSCMVFKTEQFCISFEICSIILNLLLLTHEYIYVRIIGACNFFTIGSVITVYHRVV